MISPSLPLPLLLFLLFFYPSYATNNNPLQPVDVPDSLPLSTARLSCCYVPWYPYLYTAPHRVPPYDGWTMRHFELLQRKTGFQCTSHHLFTGSFNDLVQLVASCSSSNSNSTCDCQLSIASLWENPNRTAVTFLPDNGFDSIHVVTRANNTFATASSDFVFKSFTLSVWMAILGLAVSFICLKLLDKKFFPYAETRRRNPNYPAHDDDVDMSARKRVKYIVMKNPHFIRVRKAIQSTLSTMLGHPSEHDGQERSVRMWIINMIIILCGLFLTLIYEASMTTLLVQDARESPYKSIDSLKNCDIKDTDVCMPLGDSNEIFWNRTMLPQSCRANKPANYYPARYASVDDMVAALLAGRCTYMLGDYGVVSKALNSYECGTLTLTGREFMTRSVAFIVPRNWEHEPALRAAMVDIQESHELPSFQEFTRQFHTCAAEKPPRITFSRLRTFFVLAFAACAALLAFMLLDPQQPLPEHEIEHGKPEEVGDGQTTVSLKDDTDET